MARHLTKNELLAKCKRLQEAKHYANRSPFTGMATLCNWVLWKEEKWYPKKLGEYNRRVAEYDSRIEDGEITLEEIRKRLDEKAGFNVDAVEFSYDKIKISKKNKFLYQIEKGLVDADNTINEISVRYMLCHFATLMDMGYGNKRLNRNKDWVNEWLMKATEPGEHGDKILTLRRKLFEEAGVYIEMPM